MKKWNSLAQLKDHIESDKSGEFVIEFNGVYLITNRARYSIIHGQLITHRVDAPVS